MSDVSVEPSGDGMVAWPEDVIARYFREGYWEGKPLQSSIVGVADTTPEATAIVDGPVRLSYGALLERADGAASRLREIGLMPDDRILVQLPNSWELMVLLLACLRSGIIPVLALVEHRGHELRYLAEHAQVRAITVPSVHNGFDHQRMARSIAERTATVEHVLVAGDDVLEDSVDLRALCVPVEDHAAVRRELEANAPDSLLAALMLLSGGTTGQPKLIARTHEDYGCYTRSICEVCQIRPDTVFLAVLPMGHSLPLGMSLATLRSGGCVVILSSPAPQRAFETIEREGVTTTAVVPAVAQGWLDARESDASRDLSSVDLMLVGGARLPDHLASRIAPALTRNLQQGYGMGEGGACLTRIGDPSDAVWHTQGRPMCDGDELLLVDNDGQPVPVGEPGELLTRGPCTIRGYYRSEEQNAEAFVGDGWLRTGDIVRIRPDGNIVVEGREKDMINRGGEKISAEEVENFAYQVDGVMQAAAVAMPDKVLGERVCLYVVPRAGSTVRLGTIEAVMSEADAARFKVPERLVLVSSLPATNIGKIDKVALRADIAERLRTEQAATRVAS